MDYIEYVRGDGPIVLTVPHDGGHTDDFLPRRQVAGWTRDWRDEGTLAIGFVVTHLLHASGLSPAVITQCLHRRFLDVNRPEGHDPYQDARLAKHYRIFHDAVDDAVRTAYQRHGRALLIDLHGFATSPGPERYDLVLGSDSGATCPLASDRVLQAMLDARGWNVAFSPDPARGVSARYRGGWTVRRTARDFRLEQVEACQIEIARHLRTGEDFLTADAERLVVDLADTLMALMHRARRGVA